MLEMLSWKSITATSSYCIVQKLIEEALEAESYFMKVSSDLNLQNIKTELDEIKIRWIWRQITHLTFMKDDEFFYSTIAMNACIIRLLQWMLVLFMMITLLEIKKKLHKDSSSSANYQKKVLLLNQSSRILIQSK